MSGWAGFIVEFLTEPHPWWVWGIVGAGFIAIIIYWIKKPWHDHGLDR